MTANANSNHLDFIKNADLRKWVERHYKTMTLNPIHGPYGYQSPEEFVEAIIYERGTMEIPLCKCPEEEEVLRRDRKAYQKERNERINKDIQARWAAEAREDPSSVPNPHHQRHR